MKHSCSFKTEKKRKTSFLIDVIRQEQHVNVQTDKYKERKKKKIKSKTKSFPALAPLQDIEQNKETSTQRLTRVKQS